MPELVWFELFPPRGLDLATVTAVVRPLASRPRLGLTRRMPVVVFECWSNEGMLRWLLGVEAVLAPQVPALLHTQLPNLGIVRRDDVDRPAVPVAVALRSQGLFNPMRLDTASSVSAGVLGTLAPLRKGECAVVQWVLGPAQDRRDRPQELSFLEAVGLHPLHEEDGRDRQHWKLKTNEPLFGLRGRIGVNASSQRASTIFRSLVSALGIANASHAELRASLPSARHARLLARVFQPTITWGCVLNAAELAALLCWPLTHADISTVMGRHVAPVPKKLLVPPGATTHDRVLGVSLHPGDDGSLVRMPVHTSLHHVQVVGPTGSGKSNLLAALARADMDAGRAMLVIEPRGDLVDDILAGVPEHRRQDIVVIEPGDSHPVGINPLHGELAGAERRADQLLNLFQEWYGSNIGPRSRDVLLHSLIALARAKDGTLADLPTLLTSVQFRRKVLAEVNDPLVLAPFFASYEAMSDAERQQAVAPVLNKARALLTPSATRRLLGQARPKFDLEDLFRKRRIVLVNLNTGVLGPEVSSFIGGILVTQLWAAIQRRATVPAAQRHPVMVVIDEVQNYLKLPVDLGDVLAQSRGVGVSWTLAHQHLDQLTPNLQASFLANARSRVVFRPAVRDLKPLAAALGGGLTSDDLERLKAFEACARLLVDSTLTRPFSVRTLPIGHALSDANKLRQASRDRYGLDGVQLDRTHAARWQGADSTPEGPIGVKRRRQS